LNTTDKTGKPKILTESDQILGDLKSELAHLKSRMSSIEQEQEQNRILAEKLSFQEELANEAITTHHKEVQINRENYQVIASVMNNLKSPVSSVVKNLSGVIAEIDDSETKKTLEACVKTASNVLHSFDDVESFCLSASSEGISPQVSVNIREFFRDVVSVFQTTVSGEKATFRLLVDKQVPETSILQGEMIKTCLKSLVNEIKNFKEFAKTTFRISSEKQAEKYGITIEDLTIAIEWEGTSDIQWKDSWLASVQSDQDNLLLGSGFNLLKTREIIRKSGGHLEVLKRKNKLAGFKLFVPLTY
jgi:hypothetical protein